MGHKGHWGEYTGNAKWSRNHAHTKVTSKNYDDETKFIENKNFESRLVYRCLV